MYGFIRIWVPTDISSSHISSSYVSSSHVSSIFFNVRRRQLPRRGPRRGRRGGLRTTQTVVHSVRSVHSGHSGRPNNRSLFIVFFPHPSRRRPRSTPVFSVVLIVLVVDRRRYSDRKRRPSRRPSRRPTRRPSRETPPPLSSSLPSSLKSIHRGRGRERGRGRGRGAAARRLAATRWGISHRKIPPPHDDIGGRRCSQRGRRRG